MEKKYIHFNKFLLTHRQLVKSKLKDNPEFPSCKCSGIYLHSTRKNSIFLTLHEHTISVWSAEAVPYVLLFNITKNKGISDLLLGFIEFHLFCYIEKNHYRRKGRRTVFSLDCYILSACVNRILWS